ncbi:MAG: hypothetical protein IKP61_10670 [Spirochaetales bacterium]|nr:hypothetical protein [Spirochaetales bacterium]
MNNKALRVLVLLLQLVCFLLSISVCVYGIVIIENTDDSYIYIAAVVRLVVILLVTVAYYKSSISNINPGNAFIILALFFLTVSELRVLSYFTALSGWSILPPRVSVRLQIFSQFMLMFLLIGYAIHYQNNEHSTISRFLALGSAAILFVSIMLPATQDIKGVWELSAPFWVLCILSGTALFTQLILLFTEPTATGRLRNLAILLMIVGNGFSFVFDAFSFTILGSSLFLLGGFIIMVVTLRNSVIL